MEDTDRILLNRATSLLLFADLYPVVVDHRMPVSLPFLVDLLSPPHIVPLFTINSLDPNSLTIVEGPIVLVPRSVEGSTLDHNRSDLSMVDRINQVHLQILLIQLADIDIRKLLRPPQLDHSGRKQFIDDPRPLLLFEGDTPHMVDTIIEGAHRELARFVPIDPARVRLVKEAATKIRLGTLEKRQSWRKMRRKIGTCRNKNLRSTTLQEQRLVSEL